MSFEPPVHAAVVDLDPRISDASACAGITATGWRWTPTMIAATREPGEAERLAEGAPGLQRRYGMPIDPRPYARPASSEPACRTVVAARLHAPERTQALLRRLRVRVMQGGLLDDRALIDAAATDAGLDPAALAAWYASDEVTAALEADAAAARNPSPAHFSIPVDKLAPHRSQAATAPLRERSSGAGPTASYPIG